MTDAASTPAELVRTFLEHCAAHRIDEAVALFDPDIEWRNTGFPTLRGAAAARALRRMESANLEFEFDLVNVATDGDTVLTDRTDHLGRGRYRASFWVCGTFKVRDGRIVFWEDHFALGSVLVGALKGLGSLARR